MWHVLFEVAHYKFVVRHVCLEECPVSRPPCLNTRQSGQWGCLETRGRIYFVILAVIIGNRRRMSDFVLD